MNTYYLKYLPLLFVFFLGQLAAQELKIEEAGLVLELPNKNWKVTGTQNNDDVSVYFCKRKAITNAEGRDVIPNLAVIVESVPEDMNLVNYTATKRTQVPFNVDHVFVDEAKRLGIGNAIAYQGNYEDPEGIAHTVYVVHLIRNSKGVQIIMDITSDLFPEYETEFTSALKSIKAI